MGICLISPVLSVWGSDPRNLLQGPSVNPHLNSLYHTQACRSPSTQPSFLILCPLSHSFRTQFKGRERISHLSCQRSSLSEHCKSKRPNLYVDRQGQREAENLVLQRKTEWENQMPPRSSDPRYTEEEAKTWRDETACPRSQRPM